MSDRDDKGLFQPGNQVASKYDPALCERVVELGAQGKSPAQIAWSLGIDRDTLDNWRKKHPRFSEACKLAKVAEQAWWEDRAQVAAFEPSADNNGTLIIRSMQARFREDYTERRDLHHSGALELGEAAQVAKARLQKQLGLGSDDSDRADDPRPEEA